jgi:hypothetical protein
MTDTTIYVVGVPMVGRRIGAVMMFLSGTAIVASPVALQLGWPMIVAGVLLGVSVGAVSGLVWVTSAA